jgi:D-threonine aldolase
LTHASQVSVEPSVIGRPVEELPTPALLLDASALRRNIQKMADWARGVVDLRPHAKTHKCVQIALLQQSAGAIGSTVATVWEAAPLVRGGVREVLIANEIVTDEKLVLLAELSGEGNVIVAVDDPQGVRSLTRAAIAAGVEIPVVIEIDVGMGRGGVRSEQEASVLADQVEATGVTRLRGVMGYEGHAVLERDHERRRALTETAMRRLLGHVDVLRAAGHDVEIVAAGGTNTHDLSGPIEGVTELQVGTYALMDTSYEPYAPQFEPALSVLGCVVSRHGRRLVLDCGSKATGIPELEQPRPRSPALSLAALHEEHALLDAVDGPMPELGASVELIVGYAGAAVNAHDAYIVVEDGIAVDVWPIVARGPGRAPSR